MHSLVYSCIYSYIHYIYLFILKLYSVLHSISQSFASVRVYLRACVCVCMCECACVRVCVFLWSFRAPVQQAAAWPRGRGHSASGTFWALLDQDELSRHEDHYCDRQVSRKRRAACCFNCFRVFISVSDSAAADMRLPSLIHCLTVVIAYHSGHSPSRGLCINSFTQEGRFRSVITSEHKWTFIMFTFELWRHNTTALVFHNLLESSVVFKCLKLGLKVRGQPPALSMINDDIMVPLHFSCWSFQYRMHWKDVHLVII